MDLLLRVARPVYPVRRVRFLGRIGGGNWNGEWGTRGSSIREVRLILIVQRCIWCFGFDGVARLGVLPRRLETACFVSEVYMISRCRACIVERIFGKSRSKRSLCIKAMQMLNLNGIKSFSLSPQRCHPGFHPNPDQTLHSLPTRTVASVNSYDVTKTSGKHDNMPHPHPQIRYSPGSDKVDQDDSEARRKQMMMHYLNRLSIAKFGIAFD